MNSFRQLSTPQLQYIQPKQMIYQQFQPKSIKNLCQKCQINLEKTFNEYDHYIYILQSKAQQNLDDYDNTSQDQFQIDSLKNLHYNKTTDHQSQLKRPQSCLINKASTQNNYKKFIEKQKTQIQQLKLNETKIRSEMSQKQASDQQYLKSQLLLNYNALDSLNKELSEIQKQNQILTHQNLVLQNEKDDFIKIKLKFEVEIQQIFQKLEETKKLNQILNQQNLKLTDFIKTFDGIQAKLRNSENTNFELVQSNAAKAVKIVELDQLVGDLQGQIDGLNHEIDKKIANIEIKQLHIVHLEEQVASLQLKQEYSDLSKSQPNQSFSETPGGYIVLQNQLNQSFEFSINGDFIGESEANFTSKYSKYQNLQFNTDIFKNIVKQKFKQEFLRIEELAYNQVVLGDKGIDFLIIQKAQNGNKDCKMAIGSYMILTDKISEIEINTHVFSKIQLEQALQMIYDGWQAGGIRGIVYLKKDGVCKYI